MVRRVYRYPVGVTPAFKSLAAALLTLLVPVMAVREHALQIHLIPEQPLITSMRLDMIYNAGKHGPYFALLAVGALA